MKKLIHQSLRFENQSGIRLIHDGMDIQSDEVLIFDTSKEFNDFINRIQLFNIRANLIEFKFACDRPIEFREFSNYIEICFDVGKL